MLLVRFLCIFSFLGIAASFTPQKSSFVSQPLNGVGNGSSMEMGYKKVFVAGATRGVGLSVVEKLAANGIEVVALARTEEAAESLKKIDGVSVAIGDAFDQKRVEDVMWGCDAAITTLGGSTDDRRVDYEGNNNVIESAGILGVTRVLLVTSIGCGSSKEAAPPAVFEVLKDVLAAKDKAENILIKYYTNVNWTIIRPGGLVSEPMTGEAILTEDNTAIGSIHREDVADLVVKALNSPQTERKILSALDPSITSSVAVEGKKFESFAV
ncbi:unnamed protein product [Cylindrotheca closterium]|uniref:NAD(P)-binding domain-containing protein n=1 Tax=Cylindrotheca closterium TaxID=2856 RepID=A0AAD2G030_9STRA|nr:unnamed protein product [Cylindrotheca closterium]